MREPDFSHVTARPILWCDDVRSSVAAVTLQRDASGQLLRQISHRPDANLMVCTTGHDKASAGREGPSWADRSG